MVEAAVNLRPVNTVSALDVVVVGKLVDQRRADNTFYSTVIAPAPDEYSQPMPFEVRSRRQLGGRDEIVSVACRVSGFFRPSYMTKFNQQTGEAPRRVRPIVVALDAIED